MNQTIISLCRELGEKSASIIKFTEDIDAIGDESPESTAILKDIRLDELEHVQKLALELSRVLIEPEDSGGEGE